jgi:hypothetical protein
VPVLGNQLVSVRVGFDSPRTAVQELAASSIQSWSVAASSGDIKLHFHSMTVMWNCSRVSDAMPPLVVTKGFKDPWTTSSFRLDQRSLTSRRRGESMGRQLTMENAWWSW